jgi:hypothetical protein
MQGGYQARLRRRGVGRYFSAAFLGVWLCGWLIGEFLALYILIHGGFALLAGKPFGPDQDPLELTAAVAAGAFVLVWLALWTLGGIAAGTELLRELWGEDRLAVTPDGLLVEWRAGPFRRCRAIPRAEIIGVVQWPRRGWLAVDTVSERIEACRLGSAAEQSEVAAALRRELGLSEVASPLAPALPGEWAEITTPEGRIAIAPSPSMRALQTRVAAGFAVAALGILAAFLSGTAGDRSWLATAMIAIGATAALGTGLWWLASARNEWRVEPGAVVLQRRVGDRVTERFRATQLALTQREDSDGDDWFALEARSGGARRRIVHRMNDDSVPRRLGLWLAERTGIPLEDRTTVDSA